MYRAARGLPLKPCPVFSPFLRLPKASIPVPYRLGNASLRQWRSVHYKSDDPTIVEKLRKVGAEVGGDSSSDGKGLWDLLDLCERKRTRPFMLSGFSEGRRELINILDADAASDKPQWTQKERQLILKALRIFGLADGASRIITVVVVLWLAVDVWKWYRRPTANAIDQHTGAHTNVDQNDRGTSTVYNVCSEEDDGFHMESQVDSGRKKPLGE